MPGQTLSTYLTEALQKQGLNQARAYNLGFVGGHSNDLLPVVAEVAQKHAADAILLNLDYRFYNSSSPVESRYPQLYQRVDWAKTSIPASLTVPAGAPAKRTSQEIGDSVVERVWKLFSIRDYLMVSLFKDTPGGAMTRESELARIRADGRPVWIKRRAKGLPLGELRKQFALGTLTEDSVYVRYLGAALDAARAEGVPVVVWAGPLDTKMLTDNSVWNRADYERNLAFLRAYVEKRGAVFVDYTDTLPAEQIVDSHHPMGVGYERLAETMAPLLAKIVRSEEGSSAPGVRRP